MFLVALFVNNKKLLLSIYQNGKYVTVKKNGDICTKYIIKEKSKFRIICMIFVRNIKCTHTCLHTHSRIEKCLNGFIQS